MVKHRIWHRNNTSRVVWSSFCAPYLVLWELNIYTTVWYIPLKWSSGTINSSIVWTSYNILFSPWLKMMTASALYNENMKILSLEPSWMLTLCMLGNFFKYLFLSKLKKTTFIPLIFFADISSECRNNLDIQMKPHILWGFIWIQIVCKGHQWSSKFTASRLRVKIQ